MDGLEPTKIERRHVWRCILTCDMLIGSEDDIWTHPIAYRVLVTMRLCFGAMELLINGQHEVNPGFIKAVVMQGDTDGEVPYGLDEVADYLCNEDEARVWWQSMFNDTRFPHRCPSCGAAAYIGFREVDCRARCRD